MTVDLHALIAKLNDATRSALEAAAGLCLARTHYDVEIEHFLLKLMEPAGTDLAAILKHFEIDRGRLAAELTASIDKLKTGNARTPAFSPSLVEMLSGAWTLASLNYSTRQVRSGHAILALANNPELRRLMNEVSREFRKINADTLRDRLTDLTAGSDEARRATTEAAAEPGALPLGGGKTPNLDQFTVNLTESARAGKLDPVLARDAEIRQTIDILMRRRQNNPILVGEAGVGKTAVVEGFAARVAAGEVPPPLRGVSVRSLDLALLQAGAGVKGEFENRLKALIAEVKSLETPIILFIDEAHTMIGAGGAPGQSDAANILKPALARGELRTIAATTWSEYKRHFEKDAALARRFQPVKIDEPSEPQCMLMLRGTVDVLEQHHQVRVLDEAVASAVRLSHRYVADRHLPDKAVSVLDTACARVALAQSAPPGTIEDVRRTLADIETQRRVLGREAMLDPSHGERLSALDREHSEAEARLREYEARWEKEKELAGAIRDLRSRVEAGDTDADALRRKINDLTAELERLQGETPLVRVNVDAQSVGAVVAAWTGVPLGRLMRDEVATLLNLEDRLGERIVGQNHALHAISQRIRTSRANLDDPGKPVGVFLLAGPSGVGKTETALALAELLYGGERNVITLNMSEFQEAHTVSTLKGSPPGYVGYGEGGVLTEAVRRRPYSVVLLDEVEKAHPDVLELFFQVFDKGRLEDGEGRQVDFKNTILILTSNAGTDTLMRLTADPETMPSADGLVKALKPELNRIFKPAFLGRLVIVPYYPVRDEVLKQIIRLKLGRIERRLQENQRVVFRYDDSLLEEVARRCQEVESGARNIDHILTNTVLPELSRLILSHIAEGKPIATVRVGIGTEGAFEYFADEQEPVAAAKDRKRQWRRKLSLKSAG